MGPFALVGIPLLAGVLYYAEIKKNEKIDNVTKEETINAIKNSYKKVITKISDKVLYEYNHIDNKKYELIKGNELINLIENIEEKIVSPNDTSFNIMNIFEKYIYGYTPLYTAFNKAFEIFEMNKNNKNILIIISDGLLNDYNIEEAKKEIIKKSNNLELIIITIYLNSDRKLNIKKFYNKKQNYFDSGAQFLFDISTQLDYHNPIIKYFIKNNWEIPLNGRANLFIEINNSDNLNEFIKMINESLELNEPLEIINNIISDSLLDKIINENYNKQFISENQGNFGRCWAYSISTVIYLSTSRIFGRKMENFEKILNKILKLENKNKEEILLK